MESSGLASAVVGGERKVAIPNGSAVENGTWGTYSAAWTAVQFTLPFAKCLSELNCKVFANRGAVQSDFAELWHINYAIFKHPALRSLWSAYSFGLASTGWRVTRTSRKQIHTIWHSWNSLCSVKSSNEPRAESVPVTLALRNSELWLSSFLLFARH